MLQFTLFPKTPGRGSPLCDFLECQVPTAASPHENVKAEIINTAFLVRRYGRQVKWEMHFCNWLSSCYYCSNISRHVFKSVISGLSREYVTASTVLNFIYPL